MPSELQRPLIPYRHWGLIAIKHSIRCGLLLTVVACSVCPQGSADLKSCQKTPPLSFYSPDALPAAQPTASKHWTKLTAFATVDAQPTSWAMHCSLSHWSSTWLCLQHDALRQRVARAHLRQLILAGAVKALCHVRDDYVTLCYHYHYQLTDFCWTVVYWCSASPAARRVIVIS